MTKKILRSIFIGLALFIFNPILFAYAAEEIDAYCVAPKEAVPHGSAVALTIKFADSDKSNTFIVQGPFKVLAYKNGTPIIVDVKRGNEKDEKGKENTEKPTLMFAVSLSPKHKLPAPATESVTFTYFVKHKEGKKGELFTTEREQQVDCSFVVQHEIAEPTTPTGGREEDDTEKSITSDDLGVQDSGTLPTSRLYFLKEWQRGFARFFTFNAVSKAELELRITNEKAAEALTINETKPDDQEALVSALENYTKAQERLAARLSGLKDTSENPRVEKLLQRVDAQTLTHAALLNQLAERWNTDPYVEDANVVNPRAARDNHLQGAVDLAQRKIEEVVVAGAAKDKNVEQKAEGQIKLAEAKINELEATLVEFITDDGAPSSEKTGPIRIDSTPARLSTNITIERQTPKRDFGDRMKAGLDQAGGMLANGKEHLTQAKASFAEKKFALAYGQAQAAETIAISGLRINLRGILRADLGGLEDGIKIVAPPMPNIPTPLIPVTRENVVEKIVPAKEETTTQPSQTSVPSPRVVAPPVATQPLAPVPTSKTPVETVIPPLESSVLPQANTTPTPQEICRQRGPTCNVISDAGECYCYDPRNCETPDCKMP